jgi:hypothetical protein
MYVFLDNRLSVSLQTRHHQALGDHEVDGALQHQGGLSLLCPDAFRAG